MLPKPTKRSGQSQRTLRSTIVAEHYAFATQFLQNFFNADVFLGTDRSSEDAVRANWNLAAIASSVGFLACVDAWLTDLRDDLDAINVPFLIIQGDADRILPIESTGSVLHKRLPYAEFVVILDGPHAIASTHTAEFNSALLDFLT